MWPGAFVNTGEHNILFNPTLKALNTEKRIKETVGICFVDSPVVIVFDYQLLVLVVLLLFSWFTVVLLS